MSLVLGIDTGGTYTDGVIVDRSTKKIVAKAKSLTTRDDLCIGITKCINNMEFDDLGCFLQKTIIYPINHHQIHCNSTLKLNKNLFLNEIKVKNLSELIVKLVE